jgi:uncharacterized protein (TIGR02466 family)
VEPAIRDAIHDKVSAFLKSNRAKETITPAPEESVSTSFYRREASILADARLEELEAIIFAAGKDYLEKTLKLAPRRLEVEHAWINLFEPGSQENQHTHDGSLLSCSYYVDAPEDCGCIVFPDPIGARRSYREFTETSGQELLNRREMAVEPKPGRLIMFESWVPHYVQCNKSDKVRISIAINLRGMLKKAPARAAANTGQAAAASAAAGVQPKSAAVSSPSDNGAQPFLVNELFDLNPNAAAHLEPIQDEIPAIVIDKFLQRPEDVRGIVAPHFQAASTASTTWGMFCR